MYFSLLRIPICTRALKEQQLNSKSEVGLAVGEINQQTVYKLSQKWDLSFIEMSTKVGFRLIPLNRTTPEPLTVY